MHKKKIVIAIDGYSSCGKSTLAHSLATSLGYIYIDSGAMYRTVTLFALRKNLFVEGKPNVPALVKELDSISISFSADRVTGKNNIYLGDENVEEEIRKPEIAGFVSPVSAIREVREAMVRIQREMGKNKGIVMDGRDIGTVVFPDAELKIFMTADPEIRAQRRFLELTGKGVPVSLEEIRQNILFRDQMDQSRTESPLRKAADAIVLDNSFLTPEEQLEWALRKVYALIGNNEN
jgi:cytidylate kinase